MPLGELGRDAVENQMSGYKLLKSYFATNFLCNLGYTTFAPSLNILLYKEEGLG
jgi:hypothetical protein